MRRTKKFLATILVLVLLTSTASIGFTASATSTVSFDAALYGESNFTRVPGMYFQVYINGRREFSGTNDGRRGVALTRNTIPSGSHVTFTVIPPEGFQLQEVWITFNWDRDIITDPTGTTFSFVTRGEPWLQSLSITFWLLPITPEVSIEVLLDGAPIEFDVPPQVIDSRTLVPLRAIFEALGAEVHWNPETQVVTGTCANTTVVLPIGSTSPTVNGEVVPIDVPATIINQRTLVPLRFVAESFGVQVDWNAETRTITITS